jgi:transposase
MLSLPPSVKIYLASERTDMRKGFDGLMAIVKQTWQLDVFSGHLFAFVGRRGDRVKLLMWDRGGFAIYYKRLERGKFRLPAVPAGASSIMLDGTQLAMLLDGIDVSAVRRPRVWEPPRWGAEQEVGSPLTGAGKT